MQRRNRSTSSHATTPDAVAAAAEPVTVTVARDVRADRQEAFERWAAEVLDLAARFRGNLGASLLRPGPGSTRYHLVYRFADGESLARWERSAERQAALRRGEDLTDRVDYAHVAGLDSFFTALTPSRPGPRWRFTVLTVAGVFAITLAFQLLVAPHVSGWPLVARLLLSAVVVVVLLGYVVMPALSRLFRRWLHPRGR
ncbi:antibiotic biosynthesis monooxygenase [Geodermatophilus sp. DSM 44513]|uniref:antibiotic biosynthesis monooxygenase n=1 Tax=Geodermatophilus sp. DSM 44513 TaxID=1528104 RepID=UPI001276476A|nr:antibiotic biosynthesis monooxygenase [Geodermatophilus sp. DSM 44513]WNV74382.1 antibiotic biosynthesis monooxygenase [Geodermatophilus sp. DSM 44513]